MHCPMVDAAAIGALPSVKELGFGLGLSDRMYRLKPKFFDTLVQCVIVGHARLKTAHGFSLA